MESTIVQPCFISVAVVGENETLTFKILFDFHVSLFVHLFNVSIGSVKFLTSNKFPYLLHRINSICEVIGNSMDYRQVRFFPSNGFM